MLIEPTAFLNVDLVVRSGRSLAALLTAWDAEVVVLHQRRLGTFHEATMELMSQRASRTVVGCLRAFTRLVRRTSGDPREAWDSATSRRFDVGVQAGHARESMNLAIPSPLLRAVVDVGGELVFTVYPPERR